ncbi:MAG: cold-shock protein [Nanoarchaeota archaeon]
MKGKVKFFNEGLGFGLIHAEDGREYSVNETEMEDFCGEDDKVEFQAGGLEAYKVRRAQS